MKNRHPAHRSVAPALAAALLVAVTAPADAQLASASASTLALAGNNTASVRGFGAISVNPAGLGMPGSGFSLAVAPVQVRLGLAPIALSDLVEFEGQVIPSTIKEEWLQRVAASGGETGTVGADASAFALTLGNVGFQVSTTATASLNLPPGVVEAALYGNSGRTGDATDLSLLGASVESFALTTAAMSFALPVTRTLVFGMTGKYTYGHGLAVGRSQGGALETDPIRATMEFPMITSCVDGEMCDQDYVRGGTGFGLDLGAMMDLGQMTVGASLQNVVSNFKWDTSKLGYRPGSVLLEIGELETAYDELPYDDAPQELRTLVEDYTLKPSYQLGAALDLTPMLTVTGDVHGRFSDTGIDLGSRYHTGVGAELRLGFVHFRGGMSKVSEGMQYGGGASLVLGPLNVSGAAGVMKGDLSDTVMAQFGLSFGNR